MVRGQERIIAEQRKAVKQVRPLSYITLVTSFSHELLSLENSPTEANIWQPTRSFHRRTIK